MPQPDALQISQGEVCGQQKHVHPTPLKHWLLRVCQVVGLTFPFCTQKSYRHLKTIKMNRYTQSCVCIITAIQQKASFLLVDHH